MWIYCESHRVFYFTEADTLDELKINIKEALECYFNDHGFRATEILIEKK